MKTVYLNMKTSQGIETVDQFTREDNQSFVEFNKYVNQMRKEYYTAGMQVYRSQRSTNDWKQ